MSQEAYKLNRNQPATQVKPGMARGLIVLPFGTIVHVSQREAQGLLSRERFGLQGNSSNPTMNSPSSPPPPARGDDGRAVVDSWLGSKGLRNTAGRRM